MLYASLICSAIILTAGIVAALLVKRPVVLTISSALGVTVLPVFAMVAFPAVWLQMAIVVGGLLIAGAFGFARRLIIPLSILAVVIAYGVVGSSALREQRRYEELRAQFPFESIEQRLPLTVPPSIPGDAGQLTRLEEMLEKEARGRTFSLERLHDSTVEHFVNSPGFGVARMVRFDPNEAQLKGEPRLETPEQGDYFRLGTKNPDQLPNRPDRSALGKLHEGGFLDFVNPRGFGYVKDRQHVAGFQSHGFSKTPEPAGEWKVASLELIGLLRHENPVVYLSSKLPKMDDLREARTRPLDPFETSALKALRDGVDLHTSDNPSEVRFLGAIRGTKQCAVCHGSKRGDLLGAFTYRLLPAR